MTKAPHNGLPRLRGGAGMEILPLCLPFPTPTCPQVASGGVDLSTADPS